MEKRLFQNKTGSTFRVAVTGPESTGKTTLALQLADHFKTVCREEYAREYLDKIVRPYSFEDVEIIARHQCLIEEELLLKKPQILIADTDLIVIKIWMEHKYKECPAWIIDEIEKHPYDLYLLCNIDIPWEADPQREHPHLRQYLFDLYFNELKNRKLNFEVASGNIEQRFSRALKLIENLFE